MVPSVSLSPSALRSFLFLPYPSAPLLSPPASLLYLLSPTHLFLSVSSLILPPPPTLFAHKCTGICPDDLVQSTHTDTHCTLIYMVPEQQDLTYRGRLKIVELKDHSGCARSALLPLHSLLFSVSLTRFLVLHSLLSACSQLRHTELCVCVCVFFHFPPLSVLFSSASFFLFHQLLPLSSYLRMNECTIKC